LLVNRSRLRPLQALQFIFALRLVLLEGLLRKQLRSTVSPSVSLLFIHAEAFAVSLSNILSGLELQQIERARKVVADPTIAEIIQEYP
jgi:hypothetical protein